MNLFDSEIRILSTFCSLHDKEATAKEIKDILNYPSIGSVNLDVVRLAKKLAPVFSYTPTKKENGQNRWWPCLFEGRYEKNGFVWTIKTEVEIWYKENFQAENFYEKVQRSLNDPQARKARLKKAQGEPKKLVSQTITYERNPDVVAEVLYNAKGICQKCNSDAPFKRKSDGTPYLEIHHVIPLSEGGYDLVDNALALCPNCHRESHFG